MAQQTYSNAVREAIGNLRQNLNSASLRMEKFTLLGKRNGKETKKGELDDVVEIANKKHHKVQKSIKADASFPLALGGRLLVNHAGGLIENSGLCLHRFFNYPMIPGSALKGVARAYAWEMWKSAEELDEIETAKKIAKQINEIFGFPSGDKALDKFCKEHNLGQEESGSVAFLPAQPKDNNWSLVVDVLTPHGGNDTTNPIPSFFLAVEKGAEFDFALNNIKASDELLQLAKKWLEEALQENGIGAKTAAGYGWFKEVKNG